MAWVGQQLMTQCKLDKGCFPFKWVDKIVVRDDKKILDVIFSNATEFDAVKIVYIVLYHDSWSMVDSIWRLAEE